MLKSIYGSVTSLIMKIDNNLSNAIRFLSIDAIQKANSGHPGMPMGMADIATVLWKKYLRHNPKNPKWFGRDRFILSNGHGCMLLYSLLHLTGYDVSMEDIKSFRQLHSKTAGHPEYGLCPGVEATTGPLGQGFANSVGMAIAEKILSRSFNKKDIEIINNHTYTFLGDGCLMEGISHEVASLAGLLKLNKLVVFWDNNNISIDGEVSGWFKENTPKRFRSYGWNVIESVNGHDFDDIDLAIKSAHSSSMPTLICCHTRIGFGSPNKEKSHESHGAPLGVKEVALTRKNLHWKLGNFEISQEIYENWNNEFRGNKQECEWSVKLKHYKKYYPKDYDILISRLNGDLSKNFEKVIFDLKEDFLLKKSSLATRKASQMILEKITPTLPHIFGGSADLTASNLTNCSHSKWMNYDIKKSNYLSYGVREFGMSAIMNGLSLYGGFRPYGGTFLVFSDYSRNAIRMSALMHQPVIYVMTHDSIGLGEDGPTHQPIEHLPSLRLIPNLNVWRPADSLETTVAWIESLKSNSSPSVLALSRQTLPALASRKHLELISKGAYLLFEDVFPDITLIATGSEVQIILDASKILSEFNIKSNVVSVPCVEVFNQQNTLYKKKVILDSIPALIIEASKPDLWFKFLPKRGGKVFGIDSFGESGSSEDTYKFFNLTAEKVAESARILINE